VLTHLNQMLLRADAERDVVDDDRVRSAPGSARCSWEPSSRRIAGSTSSSAPAATRSRWSAGPWAGSIRWACPARCWGSTEDLSLTDSVVHLDPGEALVCYTDGLMDRRTGKRAFGEEGIVKAMYQGKGLSAAGLARLIEAEAVSFVDDDPADDMAVQSALLANLGLGGPQAKLAGVCWRRMSRTGGATVAEPRAAVLRGEHWLVPRTGWPRRSPIQCWRAVARAHAQATTGAAAAQPSRAGTGALPGRAGWAGRPGRM
jgi:hypothetical protein